MVDPKDCRKPLSPKQLAEMTDEQIIASTQNFSYDIEQCDHRLQKGGDWNRLIHAHLFYDHVLTNMLEEALEKPEYVQLDRMTFAAKVDVCAALALIFDEQRTFLRYVNKLRNCIAHDLNFKVTRDHAKQLYERCPQRLRDEVDGWRKGRRGSLMYGTLFIFAVLLDISRQKLAAGRLLEQKGQFQLAEALEKARRVLGSRT